MQDFRLRTPDGHYLWFALKTRPVVGSDGEVVRLVGTLTDVTYSRRVKEVVRAVEGSVSLIDHDGWKYEYRMELALDGRNPGPDTVITAPFALQTDKPLDPAVATITGREFHYAAPVPATGRVAAQFLGFGATAAEITERLRDHAERLRPSLCRSAVVIARGWHRRSVDRP